MEAPPVGTITFLFTDIEGSSRLWQEQPDAMGEALTWHDVMVRDAIVTHGGYIFKAAGDSFSAAFDRAPAAVEAALAAQRSLARGDAEGTRMLHVRMAIHTGTAAERSGDYFGPAVNRVSRLLEAANGGQILLSQAARALVLDELQEGAALVDLGVRRLRDLREPDRIYQLTHPELPFIGRALRTDEYTPHNLPLSLSSFVGREAEIAEVRRRLSADCVGRLVTLTGAGGCGKTRLALEVAAGLLRAHDVHGDGIWMADLSAVSDSALVAYVVAAALGVAEEGGRPIAETLAVALGQKRLLLLLDNCEHLLDACSTLVGRLLQSCPGLRVLATGREPLGVAGETVLRVPSLPLPEAADTLGPRALMRYASVRLFVERARAVRPSFTLNRANAAAVALICRRLDGLPLAIELAAALAEVLAPEEIAAGLNDRFRILSGGSRTAVARHRTLRAVVDWDYDLLNEAERALFRRLSVFANGWTLDAASDACAGGPVPEDGVLDLLARLVKKSLVGVSESAGQPTRYTMLESIRQYAQDRLLDAGEADRLRARHHDYFLRLATEAEPHLLHGAPQRWLDRLETEHDNLRAALAWSVEPPRRMELATALSRFWLVRGYMAEGRAWLEGALARRPGAADALQARALVGLGVIAWSEGDYPRARDAFEQSLDIRRALGDRPGIAGALNNLGLLAHDLGHRDEARLLHEESLRIEEELGSARGVATSLNNLGLIALSDHRCEEARDLHERSLGIRRAHGDSRGVAGSLHNLALVAVVEDRLSEAARLHGESLRIERELGNQRGIVASLEAIADLLHRCRDPTLAVVLIAAAHAARRRKRLALPPILAPDQARMLQEARAFLGIQAFDAAWHTGTETPFEHAVGLAQRACAGIGRR